MNMSSRAYITYTAVRGRCRHHHLLSELPEKHLLVFEARIQKKKVVFTYFPKVSMAFLNEKDVVLSFS